MTNASEAQITNGSYENDINIWDQMNKNRMFLKLKVNITKKYITIFEQSNIRFKVYGNKFPKVERNYT